MLPLSWYLLLATSFILLGYSSYQHFFAHLVDILMLCPMKKLYLTGTETGRERLDRSVRKLKKMIEAKSKFWAQGPATVGEIYTLTVTTQAQLSRKA